MYLKLCLFFFDIHASSDAHEAEGFVGCIIQEVEKVLVRSGWSALRQVSFKFSMKFSMGREARETITKLPEVLQFLPDKYLNISNLEFDAVDPSIHVVKFEFEF